MNLINFLKNEGIFDLVCAVEGWMNYVSIYVFMKKGMINY
jgi:hypothetical protein